VVRPRRAGTRCPASAERELATDNRPGRSSPWSASLILSYHPFMKKRAASPPPELSPETQARDDVSISGDILAPEVVEHPPAPADHQEQTSPGVVVLLMGLQVLGEIRDAPSEDGDLNLRGTGVRLASPVLGDELGLVLFRERHVWKGSLPPSAWTPSAAMEHRVAWCLDERGKDAGPHVSVGPHADLRDAGA
jgi:hypothetical protein